MTNSRLREPGLRRFAAGHERYTVRGRGLAVVALEAGDQITITDIEGRQSAELIGFDRQGHNDNGIFDATARNGTIQIEGAANATQALLATQNSQSAKVLAALKQHGITLGTSPLRGVQVLGAESTAGSRVKFQANRQAICIVSAPGEPMRVDQQNPATAIGLDIHRAAPGQDSPISLPTPLADPRLDFRIDARTARAYEVRAGEYVQIIDVQGRECSDFQVFSAAGLDAGLERCLDATTTRTLMGAAYPGPGLFSKAYDQAMQPLVEVIRDTVGRHDTFGLACSAKYYDDSGYPGHINCSENFNAALSPFGVQARLGWEAINFFYNTNIDEHNQIYLDEPWSRPGDYVLLKALTDLVCVSSACPDDTSAANGWNPTDIHVRVYPAAHTFSKAVAYRMTPDAETELTRETGFHQSISEHTRQFSEYRGFWLPTSFTQHGAIDEYWACREHVAVMDLSPLRKFEVFGPDAEALLQWAVTRNIRKLTNGQVVYTAMCHDTGGMLDDGTVFRLADNNFRWIGGDDYSGLWLRQQAAEKGYRAWVKSSTDELHNVALQGPKSRTVLTDVIWTPDTQPSITELGWFRFTIGRIGDMNGKPVIVSRTGYTGELGYEIWCHPRDAKVVWDSIWEAGQPHGLSPLGLDALDMLRIEAGLVFAGYEFCDQTDPFEAGIPFVVPLKTKEDDFIGKAALQRRKASPQRVLVGLELAGAEPGAHGDCVHPANARLQIGEITSATRSPILRKNIALCRMAVDYASPGTEVEVGKLDGHQKRIPARVVPFPFYDPEKLRVRA